MVHCYTKPAPATEFVIRPTVSMGLGPIENLRDWGGHVSA